MLIFDDFDGYHPKAGPYCMACEAMLTDAVDGTLGEVDKVWFDQHIASCTVCAERFMNAQRGSAWLEMLKTQRPEPGADLMARIMAKTAEAGPIPQPKPKAEPVRPNNYLGGMVIPFPVIVQPKAPWRMLLEPRMAMTAAMAFFSLALTLNLTGVHLNQLSLNDLKPESLQRTYYNTSTKAVQYYDNLRVVHVMESRVEDLQEANQDREQRLSAPAEAQPKAEPQAEPKSDPKPNQKNERKPEQGPGTSRQETPALPGSSPRVLVADARQADERFSNNNKAGRTSRWTSTSLLAAVWQWNGSGGRG